MAWIAGAGLTAFGRHEGEDTLTLTAQAATQALADAGIGRAEVDGLLCGYSMARPHIMPANLFAEYFGLDPEYCCGLAAGGATGIAMLVLAMRLAESGRCRNLLVLAGENRLTGQGADQAVRNLAQVGHPDVEQPFGPSIPALYGLVASRYMYEFGAGEADLAEFAVLMRRHAAATPGAHFRDPVTVADVLASRPIAAPLKLLDCCPISDGAAAFVIKAEPGPGPRVRLAGAGQSHGFLHVTAAESLATVGAGRAAHRALAEAGIGLGDIDVAGIYDPFTISLLVFLEEIGFAPRGEAAALARDGHFGAGGPLPLNPHGGLLSYGHSGIAGGLAHLAEVYRQLAGKAGERQIAAPEVGFVHGEGGIMSAHASLVLVRE